MGWLVVLKLNGDLEHQGFQVTLDIAQEGYYPILSQEAELPPNPLLAMHLSQWQKQYTHITSPARVLKPHTIEYDGFIDPVLDKCVDLAKQLATTFKQWLRANSFRDLEQKLSQILSTDDIIRVLIRTTNPQLHALPWHLWSFIEEYPQSEVAIGSSRFQQPPEKQKPISSQSSKVSILAVLGDRTNIDVESDRRLLNQLRKATVELLVEPSLQQLHDQLYTRPWDILFFAGHSNTLEAGKGILQLNPTTALTIDDLKYGLKQAIANGLQLAIFNSCSGIGLAQALAELQLPQMIVMRQAIPDHVAHIFLKYFLNTFAQGASLYQAERQARERLQSLEQDFPCASWLPMIYQNPAKTPPSWQIWQRPSIAPRSTSSVLNQSLLPSTRLYEPAIIVSTSILIASLIVGMRSLGLLQASELHAFDHLVQLRNNPRPDARVVVVTIDNNDMRYQDQHNFKRRTGWSLSDQALGQLLQWLKFHPPRVIGLDMIHPYAFDETIAKGLNKTNIMAVCHIGTEETPTDDATPPPGFENERLGFSDFPLDEDGKVRRQLLLMTAGDLCQTSRSFSLQLVHRYLAVEGIGPIEKAPNGDRYLGEERLNRLRHNTGGYQLPVDHANGYQILLNYRYADPLTIPLRQLLEKPVEEEFGELLRDRIVIIGGNQPQQDQHKTSSNSSVPGAILHAHMVSQLLDITLEKKSQLWWWPQWGESIWIASWAIVGGGLGWHLRSPWKLGLATAGTILIVYGLCWFVFVQDGWIPLVPTIIAVCLTTLVARNIITTFKCP